jgi:hypothetical protein
MRRVYVFAPMAACAACSLLVNSDGLTGGDVLDGGMLEAASDVGADADDASGASEAASVADAEAGSESGARGPLAYISGTTAMGETPSSSTVTATLASTAGMVPGESLVVATLAVFNESNSATIAAQVVTAGAGWNLIPSAGALIDRAKQYNDQFQLVAFWRRWDGSNGYSFSVPILATYWSWAIVAISGVNPSNPNPIEFASSTVAMPATEGGVEPTSVGPSPSGTVPHPGDMLVAFMIGNQGHSIGSSMPAGFAAPFVSPGPGYVVEAPQGYVGLELLETSMTVPAITFDTRTPQSDGLAILAVGSQ